MKRHLIAACLLTFTGLSFASTAKIGSPAPDFELPGIDGKTHTLSSYLKEGKVVVLEWQNDGCPFVKKHYESNNMQQLQKKYTSKGVAWLTINSSAPGKQGALTPETGAALKKARDAHFTQLLLDSDGKVGTLYGAKTTPQMVVINAKGKLVYNGAIDDKATTDTDDVKGATNYVVAALDATLAGKPVKISSTKPYGCSVKYKH